MTRYQKYLLLLTSGVWAAIIACFLLDLWPNNRSANDSMRIISTNSQYNINKESNASLNYVTINSNHIKLVSDNQTPKSKFNITSINIKQNIENNVSKSKLRTLPNLDSLNALPVIPQSSVKRILLFAYFRSGSSFVGDLLQQNEKTFYSFEPLHRMSQGVRIEEHRVVEAIRAIDSIFRCQFDDIHISMGWVKEHDNKFLREVCPLYEESFSDCFTPNFLSQVCQTANVNAMKVVRLQMRHLRTLLPKLSDLDVRVVYLVRDPRAILNSRLRMSWCTRHTNCWDIGVLCSEMTDDFNEFSELRKLYPNNTFTLIRYEDLAINAYNETKALYDKLGINFTSSVEQFISSHTNPFRGSSHRNPFSTQRDSKKAANAWKQSLRVRDILKVEQKCAHLLQHLNYELFLNQTDPTIKKTIITL